MADAGEVACRICGSPRHVALCRNLNEHSHTRWLDSFRCSDCGSVFIGNFLSLAELAEAYASIDEAAYYAETAQASAAKFARAAHELATLAPKSVAIIDIGGGHGAFARALKTEGFGNLALHEIPGCELPGLAGIVRAVYRDRNYQSLPPRAFDVVTMMDVMEHVPDVDAAFAAARRVLRPGGILYLHTPVVTRLDRAMHAVQKLPLLNGIGRAWQRSRTSVFHLQNFTPRALRMLADRHGFEVMRVNCLNELSWPVSRYVRVYLVGKAGLPRSLAPLAALFLTPLLRSRFNANKGVLVARLHDKSGEEPR